MFIIPHALRGFSALVTRFDQRIELMPALYERTNRLSNLTRLPAVQSEPAGTPSKHASPLFTGGFWGWHYLRDNIAKKHKIWIGNPAISELPNQCKIEWYVGDNFKLAQIMSWSTFVY